MIPSTSPRSRPASAMAARTASMASRPRRPVQTATDLRAADADHGRLSSGVKHAGRPVRTGARPCRHAPSKITVTGSPTSSAFRSKSPTRLVRTRTSGSSSTRHQHDHVRQLGLEAAGGRLAGDREGMDRAPAAHLFPHLILATAVGTDHRRGMGVPPAPGTPLQHQPPLARPVPVRAIEVTRRRYGLRHGFVACAGPWILSWRQPSAF